MIRNQPPRTLRQPSRALVIGLFVLPLAALSLLATAHLTAGTSNTQVLAVGQHPLSTGQPQPSTPEIDQQPETLAPASSETPNERSPARTQPLAPPQPNLGLDEIVREFILKIWGGETVRADLYEPSTYTRLESDDPATRRRGEFELKVMVELGANLFDNPYYQQLHKLMFDNWDACLKEYGLPSLLELGRLSKDQQDSLYKERSLVGERLTQLEDKCWQQARIHTDKDDETNRLLELLHLYFVDVAQEWVKANPEAVVPMT